MTGRRRWTVRVTTDAYTVFARGWRVREVAEGVAASSSVRPVWREKAWTLPVRFAADLIAALEYYGALVKVDGTLEADQPQASSPQAAPVGSASETQPSPWFDPMLPLDGGGDAA